ncbi:MAG: AAA family ATPase [Candidatus Thiodiazotropha sp.]
MKIEKLIIENFKCFKEKFTLELGGGLNIIVGDNESGKSTILEAINLALTGLINGRYLRNELTQYFFNDATVKEYLTSLTSGSPKPPPHILIELHLSGDGLAKFEGDKNSEKIPGCGLFMKIEFNEKYRPEYQCLLDVGELSTIPIEYYTINWIAFSRDSITARSIPLKTALIDSTSTKYPNGSDVYISRIVKELLSEEEIVSVSQAHRNMKEAFMGHSAIDAINKKVAEAAKISDKNVKLSVELSSKNAWEGSLTTYLDDIPFHHVGKGEQCMVKTNLALAHNKSKEASLILLEEPENHLSHSKLNQLIRTIRDNSTGKQIIITSHSSFVANKLGLNNLILLNDKLAAKLCELSESTRKFFEKIPGYDTLRLLLCSKAILVEGDSDELIVQKAYIDKYGKLPIEDNIDVISVGTSFLRFLEIAEKINKEAVVVTDNDGDVEAIRNKYEEYLGGNSKDNISVCFDEVVDSGNLEISGKKFNYNTLEPKLVKANDLQKMNSILGTSYAEIDGLHKYMKLNKTDCALKFFETGEGFNYPPYILEAISNEQ